MKHAAGWFAVLIAACQPPIAPVITQQGPAQFALIGVAANSVYVSVSWSAASDPSGISLYEWRDSTTLPAGALMLGSTIHLVDTFGVAKPPLNGRHEHEFQVRAVDGVGNQGPYSAKSRWAIVYSDTIGPNAPGGVTLDTLIRLSEVPTLRQLAGARNFQIGAAVRDTPFANIPIYRATLVAQYNSMVPEDATDFWPIHPGPTTYAFARADSLVAFAQANGMTFHGHTLTWYSWIPTWVTNGGYTNDQLRQILKDHITTVVGRYAGKAVSWDVVNEPIENDGSALHTSFWIDRLGPEYIDSAFLWANRADPAAKLYLNEWGAELIGPKSDRLLQVAQGLKARGIPIHGVGFQAHLSHFWPHPTSAQIKANLDRFAAAGFDLRITELDSDIADTAGAAALAQQGVVYRDVLDACLRTPRCLGVTTWGFTDKYHWVPTTFPGYGRALPFDANYQPKPAFDSLLARLGRP